MHAFWVTVLDRLALFFLQALVVTCLALLHRLYPEFRQWLIHHTSVQERQLLSLIGKEAFIYAESVLSSRPGQEKLAAALQYATSVSNRRGLSLTPDELRSAIENAVQESRTLRVTHQRTSS